MDAVQEPSPAAARPTLSGMVARRIKGLLAENDSNPTALSRKLEVSQTYVWRRLTGRAVFDLDDVERIAEALGVTWADLLPLDHRSANRSLYPRIDLPVTADPLDESMIGDPLNDGSRSSVINGTYRPTGRVPDSEYDESLLAVA